MSVAVSGGDARKVETLVCLLAALALAAPSAQVAREETLRFSRFGPITP